MDDSIPQIEDSIAYCESVVSFFCKKKGINGELFRELQSVGYVGLAEALKTYKKNKGPLKSYIYHKVKFEVCNYIRNQIGKRSKKKRIEFESPHVQFIENSNIFTDIIYNKIENKDLIYKILVKMNSKRAKILYDYFFLDMTLLQIAEKMNCTKANIHYHYKKAVKEFRKQYTIQTTDLKA